MNVLEHFGGDFGSLGMPFGLILSLLGRFWISFEISWDALGRHAGPRILYLL